VKNNLLSIPTLMLYLTIHILFHNNIISFTYSVNGATRVPWQIRCRFHGMVISWFLFLPASVCVTAVLVTMATDP